MRHDAVGWVGGAPTNARIVSTNCGMCHHVADSSKVTWATGKAGGTVQYHASLNNAGQAQPTSCIDCHANSRPPGALTRTNASLPAGVAFDHAEAISSATGDCAACHAASAAPSFTSWRQGQYHPPGATNPPTCLPCHAGERPTSTATAGSARRTRIRRSTTWPTLPARPTAMARIARSATTGPAPARGASTQNWASGPLRPRSDDAAAQTCIACHSTQRPDLQPGDAGGRRGGCRVRPCGRRRRRVPRLPRGDDRRPASSSTTPTRRRTRCRAAIGRVAAAIPDPFLGIERPVHQRHRDDVGPEARRPTTCCAR